VFPPNVRLDWKGIASYKQSSLFCLIVSDEEKSFITLTPGSHDGAAHSEVHLSGRREEQVLGLSLKSES
jgi:hypothetical protein